MTAQTLFCHEGNVAEFNAALRTRPEIRDFVAALHGAGLIDGLRGAWLRPDNAPTPANLQGVVPVLSAAAETRLADARWQRQQKCARTK